MKGNIFFEITCITCNPSIYTMDHPDLTVSNFMENSVGLKRVKELKDIDLSDDAAFIQRIKPSHYYK